MSDLNEAFGAWREVLQGPPSARAWRHLCDLAGEAWFERPRAFAEQWLPYAQTSLRRWPDALRVAPAWLCELATESDDPAPLMLARRAEIEGMDSFEFIHGQELPLDVRALRLRKEPLSEWSVARMRDAPCLAGLEELSLEDVQTYYKALGALREATWLGGLRRFAVDCHSDTGMRRSVMGAILNLLHAADFAQLEELSLVFHRRPYDNYMLLDVIARLEDAGLSSLRALSVARCDFMLQPTSYVEAFDLLEELESLALTESYFGDDQPVQLFSNGDFSNLRHLSLAGTITGPWTFEFMAQTFWLPRLEHLVVTLTLHSQPAFEAMLMAATRLRRLEIVGTRLDAERMASLIDSGALRELHQLDLTADLIEEEAMELLCERGDVAPSIRDTWRERLRARRARVTNS